MCAGRCREPRRKGTRVAAPSGCVVPWAARASCWPQPQQLLPVSAAGSGRRCCTGAFPRRTIRRVDAVRIHPCSPFCKTDKTETPVPGSDTGVLGGRVWIARAALLKTAHWAVFALSSATAPQLFESTLAAPFSRQVKQKLRYPLDTGVLGGRGWIRTTEAESSRFTVCPHWPLGNTPIFSFCSPWIACIYYHPDGSLSTSFCGIFGFLCRKQKHKSKSRPEINVPERLFGAGDRS